MGLAVSDSSDKQTYRVSLKKPPRKDVVEYFASKIVKLNKKAAKQDPPPTQRKLFEND
jgi:hypothetical protein